MHEGKHINILGTPENYLACAMREAGGFCKRVLGLGSVRIVRIRRRIRRRTICSLFFDFRLDSNPKFIVLPTVRHKRNDIRDSDVVPSALLA